VNRSLTVITLAALVALLGVFAWWWSVRLDSNGLQDTVIRDAGRSATFVSAHILHLESGTSAASANLVLEYQYQNHHRRVPADLRLQRVGNRWHITEVFAGNRQFPSLEKLGQEVSMDLAAEFAAEQARKTIENTVEIMESLGDVAIEEGRKTAEALRKKWKELNHDD
jgi:hypothetical protein